jgi:hypothetical protein
MKATIEQVEVIIATLTSDEKQLLKDTINRGFWGDADSEFLDENGNIETVMMNGYCTNDAVSAGHFKGRAISAMFRSIYGKLCPNTGGGCGQGRYISHCSDWWGDGKEGGDMLFIRESHCDAFEEWAKQ